MIDTTSGTGHTEDSALPHLVIHGSEATGIQHVVASNFAEATAYAEYLANQQDDDSARIFEMRELSVSFSTYYQVHLVKGRANPMPPNEPHLVVGGGPLPRVVPIPA